MRPIWEQNMTMLCCAPLQDSTCELNAIELIWAQVKKEVAVKNVGMKITQVMQLTIKGSTQKRYESGRMSSDTLSYGIPSAQ